MAQALSYLALMAAMWLVSSWLLMLGVGIIHADWVHALPTIGFPISLLLNALAVIRVMAAATSQVMVKRVEAQA
jgi:hypothetical protein